MTQKPIYLLSAASTLGKDRITNEELCQAFNAALPPGCDREKSESTPEMVVKLSGITERRVYTKEGLLDPSHLSPILPKRSDDEVSIQAEFALDSAKKVLERSKVPGEKIDLIIFSASSIQRPYPAVAIEIANHLGSKAIAFDMNVGCASVAFAVNIAEQFLKNGTIKTALVVTAELTTFYTNWRDRGSHFLFGDASGALLFSSEDHPAKQFELMGSKCWTEYSSNIRNNYGFAFEFEKEVGRSLQRPDRYFYQNGPKAFKDVVRIVPVFIANHLNEMGIDRNSLKRLWLHQANARMNLAIAEKFIPSRDPAECAPLILDKCGNSASAGAVVALDHFSEGLSSGDLGYLCAFGAGYSAGGLLLKKV